MISTSRSRSDTATTTSNTSRNLNIQDVEGITVADSGGVSISTTDQGAIAVAESIAVESLLGSADQSRQAFTLVRDLGEANIEFGRDTLNFADRSNERVFDFAGNVFDFAGGTVLDALTVADQAGGRALDFADQAGARQATTFADALQFADDAGARERSVLSDSLAFGERTLSGAGEFAESLFGKSLEAVTGVVQESQAQLGNTVSNLNAIARQQSTSSDERVQQIATSALKYGAIGLGVLAAGFLAMRYAR